MSINQWPKSERPRERLLAQGAQALSDAELLAIFLRTGVQGKSAVDLARELITQFGGLRPLMNASRSAFCEGLGLGDAKFAQLKAVLEMSNRHMAEELADKPLLNSAENASQYVSMQLRALEHEVFAVMFLDSQYHLISFEVLFKGTVNAASVYPREVVKRALAHNASAVMFAHNHPSGYEQPSDADKRVTEQLKKALALIDVQSLDHFIVGANATFSFAEAGLM